MWHSCFELVSFFTRQNNIIDVILANNLSADELSNYYVNDRLLCKQITDNVAKEVHNMVVCR